MEGHHSVSDQSSSSSPLSNSAWSPGYTYLHFESPELPSPIGTGRGHGRILNFERPQYYQNFYGRPITGRHHFDFTNAASNSDFSASQLFTPEAEEGHSVTPVRNCSSRRQLFPESQSLLHPQQIQMPRSPSLGPNFSSSASSTKGPLYMGTANYSGRPLTRNYMNPPPGRECKFCKNNGEMSSMYRSHVLRSPDTGFLVCPVLRAHVCEVCGATGDYGHTRNYCPKIQDEKRMKFGLPVSLKMTKRQSDGRIRQD